MYNYIWLILNFPYNIPSHNCWQSLQFKYMYVKTAYCYMKVLILHCCTFRWISSMTTQRSFSVTWRTTTLWHTLTKTAVLPPTVWFISFKMAANVIFSIGWPSPNPCSKTLLISKGSIFDVTSVISFRQETKLCWTIHLWTSYAIIMWFGPRGILWLTDRLKHNTLLLDLLSIQKLSLKWQIASFCSFDLWWHWRRDAMIIYKHTAVCKRWFLSLSKWLKKVIKVEHAWAAPRYVIYEDWTRRRNIF